MVAVGYAASKAKAGSAVDLRPDLVTVQGSTAGAGSTTYNKYRHMRDRELTRVRNMEAASKEADLDAAFRMRTADAAAECEDRTRRNAERRRRKRGRKALAKELGKAWKLPALAVAEPASAEAGLAAPSEAEVAALAAKLLEQEAAADPEVRAALVMRESAKAAEAAAAGEEEEEEEVEEGRGDAGEGEAGAGPDAKRARGAGEE